MYSFFISFFVLVLTAIFCVPTPIEACTGFFIKAKDGGVAYARSLEFAINLKSKVAIVPRGTSYVAKMPDGTDGLEWKAKYGIVGLNIFDKPLFLDGFNEKGLLVGMFYFPGFTEYAAYDKSKAKQSLGPTELGTWLLSNFATVDEVKQHIKNVRIVPTVLKELGLAPPLHTMVVDATGKAIVIEPINGRLIVYDNPVNVITNAPTFDWHLTNLRQYIHLSTQESTSIELGKLKVGRIGTGSGMIGIPGDITPPSRFVRAAYYVNRLPQPQTVEQGLNQVMRLMNYFFITKGMVMEKGQTSEEYMQWQSFVDLKNKRFYFSTYDNLNIRMVDMNKLKLNSGSFRQIDINQPQTFQDLSNQAK